jgi:hypothetical protein
MVARWGRLRRIYGVLIPIAERARRRSVVHKKFGGLLKLLDLVSAMHGGSPQGVVAV